MPGDRKDLRSDQNFEESDYLTPTNFPVLKNDRILRAAKEELPDKLPVWIMRQAGRHLPEYQELRKNHSFLEICHTPSLASEVTLMPIRRFDLDAAIIFSDTRFVAEALGMEVVMTPNGPTLPDPLTLETLPKLNAENAIKRLQFVGQAITLTRHKLKGKVPLFGFSGAPWSLMGFMIEGGSSAKLSKARKWLYSHKSEAHQLLQLLTNVIIDYLVMQVEAGAQILQVFDTRAEFLNNTLYEVYGLPYLKQIRSQVREKLLNKNLEDVPMALFAKGGCYCLEEQSKLGYEILGIDWTVSPTDISIRDSEVTLQGNLDPFALCAPKDDLVKHTTMMIEGFGVNRYIVNLGHGIPLDAAAEAVETFIQTVHSVKL